MVTSSFYLNQKWTICPPNHLEKDHEMCPCPLTEFSFMFYSNFYSKKLNKVIDDNKKNDKDVSFKSCCCSCVYLCTCPCCTLLSTIPSCFICLFETFTYIVNCCPHKIKTHSENTIDEQPQEMVSYVVNPLINEDETIKDKTNEKVMEYK